MVFPTISSTKLFSVLGNVDVSCLNTIPPLAALVQRNVLDSLQSSVVVVFPTVSSTKLFSVLGRVSGNVGPSPAEGPAASLRSFWSLVLNSFFETSRSSPRSSVGGGASVLLEQVLRLEQVLLPRASSPASVRPGRTIQEMY